MFDHLNAVLTKEFLNQAFPSWVPCSMSFRLVLGASAQIQGTQAIEATNVYAVKRRYQRVPSQSPLVWTVWVT